MVFVLINVLIIGIWVGFGSMLCNVLCDLCWLRVFNVGMVLLLVVLLYLIFVENYLV